MGEQIDAIDTKDPGRRLTRCVELIGHDFEVVVAALGDLGVALLSAERFFQVGLQDRHEFLPGAP